MSTPRKTNMEPENTLWKRSNIHKPPIFGFHVNFRGCTSMFQGFRKVFRQERSGHVVMKLVHHHESFDLDFCFKEL